MLMFTILFVFVLVLYTVLAYKLLNYKKEEIRLKNVIKRKNYDIKYKSDYGIFPNIKDRYRLRKIGDILSHKNVISKKDARFLSEFLIKNLDEQG